MQYVILAYMGSTQYADMLKNVQFIKVAVQ